MEDRAGPATSLDILDLGAEREIVLSGPAFYHGGWHLEGARYRTSLRAETVHALHEAKGAFLLDEIYRVDDPGYVSEQFLGFVRRYVDLPDREILDFGCGCGSSSILLARDGARVTGVEPNAGHRRAARLRAEDLALSGRLRFVDAERMTTLPFAPESFDAITLSAVVEHIKPSERRPILHHLWRLLRPGGLLFVTETPNRLWPYDGHTTRLPLVSWLPLSAACALARLLRPGEFGRTSQDEFVADGIVGSTWWAIRRALPDDAVPLPLDSRREHAAYFARLRPRKRGLARLVVEGLRLLLLPIARMQARAGANRMPVNALLPYLNLVFVKPPRE